MKDPKDMTREYLAEWYYTNRDAGSNLDAEIMNRLRNSIDRPKVAVVEIDSAWYISINDQTPDVDAPQNYYEAQELLSRFKAALGMEGGEG